MYSRNITLSDTRGASRAISDRDPSRKAADKIPVRSFVDSSAYEHFGNIGRKPAQDNARPVESTEDMTSGTVVLESSENVEEKNDPIAEVKPAVIMPKESDTAAVSSNHDSHAISEYIKPTLSGLFKGFDTDILILLSAAALLYFGKGNERNTLTPIALIAIAFL